MHCGPHVHQLIIATQSNHINKMHLEWKSRSDYTTCKACSGIQRYLLPWITTSDKMQCIAGGQWWWWIWTWWYSKICVHMLIGGCPMVERMHAYASIYLLWSSRVHGRHITIILFESSKKTIACSVFFVVGFGRRYLDSSHFSSDCFTIDIEKYYAGEIFSYCMPGSMNFVVFTFFNTLVMRP